MRVFVCFFAFFGAKIWPAAADTGELARDLRDQTHISPRAAGAPYPTERQAPGVPPRAISAGGHQKSTRRRGLGR